MFMSARPTDTDAECPGCHTKTQIFQQNAPSGGSYVVERASPTLPVREESPIKNRAPRKFQKWREFTNTPHPKTAAAPPPPTIQLRNHRARDRQTSSRHFTHHPATFQPSSARNSHRLRKVYRAFLHPTKNACKPEQLHRTTSHN